MGSATFTLFTLLILLIATTSNGRPDSLLKLHSEDGNKESQASTVEIIVKDSRTHFFYGSYNDDNSEVKTSSGEKLTKTAIPKLIMHGSYVDGNKQEKTSTGEASMKDYKIHFLYTSGKNVEKASTPGFIIHGNFKDGDKEMMKISTGEAFMKNFQIHFLNGSHQEDKKEDKTIVEEVFVKEESKPTPIHFFYGSYASDEAFLKDSKPSPDFIISSSYRNVEGKPILNHFLYEDKTGGKSSKYTPTLIVHGSYLEDKEGKKSNVETVAEVFKPTPKTAFYTSHQDGEKEVIVRST